MTMKNRVARGMFSLALSSLACGGLGSSGDPPSVGTNTNWLSYCSSDQDCGPYSCICGICTTSCNDSAPCTMAPQASCGSLSEGLCGEGPAPASGVCLLECQEPSDCGTGRECVDGTCVGSEHLAASPELRFRDGRVEDNAYGISGLAFGSADFASRITVSTLDGALCGQGSVGAAEDGAFDRHWGAELSFDLAPGLGGWERGQTSGFAFTLEGDVPPLMELFVLPAGSRFGLFSRSGPFARSGGLRLLRAKPHADTRPGLKAPPSRRGKVATGPTPSRVGKSSVSPRSDVSRWRG